MESKVGSLLVRLGVDDTIRVFTLFLKGDIHWMTEYKWEPPIEPPPQPVLPSLASSSVRGKKEGVVYLLRAMGSYKIGKTKNPDSRKRQLDIQLPEKAELVHQIITDDIDRLERHWHQYFADKRGNGEWFGLTDEDVHEFTAYRRIETL